MGTTRLKSTLDHNTISCTYYRDISVGESTAPVDLTVYVNHRYTTSTNLQKEITLETLKIPKEYLETKGLTYLSDVQQKVDFNILNLRYLTDLFIEVHETRDSTTIVTTANVLTGDDPSVDPLVDNPQKDPENDENIPEVVPEQNISDPVQESTTTLYSLHMDETDFIQISKRIYLDSDEEFKTQDYNEVIDRVFVENSITNMMLNAALQGSAYLPTHWVIEAPGVIVNSHLISSEVEGVNRWQLKITNPNLFSAFNTVTLLLDNPQPLLPGLNALTFSVYYRVISTSSEIPFTSFMVKVRFFMDQTELGFEDIFVPVTSDQNTWQLMVASLQGSQIRLGANKYLVEIDIADINKTDLFTLDLMLPQMEPLPFATTRTLDSRIQDRYLTKEEVVLSIPFYVMAESYHIIGPGLRGIFASTVNLKDGIEIQVSSDRLFLKVYDTSGGIIANIASDPFIANEGENITYGVWVDAGAVEFYIDGILLSSHSASLTITQTKQFILGSLERANSTLNSELLDLRILKVKP